MLIGKSQWRSSVSLRNGATLSFLMALAPWFAWDYYPTGLIALLSALSLSSGFIRINSRLLTFIALGLSAALLAYYEFRVIPESAIATLGLMILAKLHQKKQKFETALILGILWTSLFALFNRELFFILYIALTYALLLGMMGKSANDKLRPGFLSRRKLFLILKTAPFIALLFIFFPRVKNIIPAISAREQNIVGYSTRINNSKSFNLSADSTPLFYVKFNRDNINTGSLYWRALTHTRTDGYNWSPAPQNSQRPPLAQATREQTNEAVEYEVFYLKNFAKELLTLERTHEVLPIGDSSARFRYDDINDTFEHAKPLARISDRIRYKGKAQLTPIKESPLTVDSRGGQYTQLPNFMPSSFQDFSAAITGITAPEIIQSFRQVIQAQGFSYRLDLAAMPTLNHFLTAKVGTCTHYASLLALTLRHRGIPARLVSGMQGASFNAEGGFFVVKSNDAHAWVEYLDQGRWHRVDPTLFIAPERINLGAAQYILSQNSRNKSSGAFYALGRKFDQIISAANYRILLFLDNYDRQKQRELAKLTGLKLQEFYRLGAFLILLALLFIFVRANVFKMICKRYLFPDADQLFWRFERKMKKKKIIIPHHWPLERIAEKFAPQGPESDFLQTYRQVKYSCPTPVQKAKLLRQLRQFAKQI